MTPNYKFDQFVGKTITLTAFYGDKSTVLEGTIVGFDTFGLLIQAVGNKVLFYPWQTIAQLDVTQAYGQLKVA